MIKDITKILKNGGVVILPTETLYGLCCDATNEKALKKIYKIKNRSRGKSFPILAHDMEMLRKYAFVNEEQEKIIEDVRRPTNFVLKAKRDKLPKITLKNGTGAFRISTHLLIKNIIDDLNVPIVATSANVAGEEPLNDPRKYREVFGKNAKLIDMVVFEGVNRRRKGSQIVDLRFKI